MFANKQTPTAFFLGTFLVFIYLFLAGSGPLGVTNMTGVSLFTLVFSYGLNFDTVASILMRSLLVFIGGFSLSWMVLSLTSASRG